MLLVVGLQLLAQRVRLPGGPLRLRDPVEQLLPPRHVARQELLASGGAGVPSGHRAVQIAARPEVVAAE
eukprot:8512224-Pyramimonas_sp.AAC.1